jgi:hypothetical protein
MVTPRSDGAAIPGGAPVPGSTSTGYLGAVAAQMAAGRVAQPSIPMVYMGTRPILDPITGAPKPYTEKPYAVSVNDMMLKFESMSDKRKRALAERLAKGGFFDQSPYKGETLSEFIARMTLADVQGAYGRLLESAAARYQAGQSISPDELLAMHIDYNSKASAGTGIFGTGEGPGGSKVEHGPDKTTSTSVDIFSATDARGLARATLRRELGRDPTEAEYEDFVAALQAKQKANPSVTTTRYTYDKNGNVVDTSYKTTGGMTSYGLDEFAQSQAEQNPGWAEWQAAGQFFPGAMAVLGSAVPGT